MPHCIIEYSKDLNETVNIEELVNTVFNGAVNSELFSSSHIKTRALTYNHYLVGETKTNFIHITVKLLTGRNSDQRKLLSDSIISELKKMTLPPISISVEVVDMEKESYVKLET